MPTSPTPVDLSKQTAELASLDTATAQLPVPPLEAVDRLDISDSDTDSDEEGSENQDDEDSCDSESEGVDSGCGHDREPEDLRTHNKSHRPFRDKQPSESDKSTDRGEHTRMNFYLTIGLSLSKLSLISRATKILVWRTRNGRLKELNTYCL